jgi:homoserine O-acetyltransferase
MRGKVSQLRWHRGEREIKKVKRGRFVLLPIDGQTRGHSTHSQPAVWQQYLDELLKSSSR